MRTLISIVLAALIAACASTRGAKAPARIMLVDESGSPVQGAVVLPEDSGYPGARREHLSEAEEQARISDPQGLVYAELDQYCWDSDSCYHFRIRRANYEDATMTVSKDLFPPVLRISLDANIQKPGQSPNPPRSPRQP